MKLYKKKKNRASYGLGSNYIITCMNLSPKFRHRKFELYTRVLFVLKCACYKTLNTKIYKIICGKQIERFGVC